MNSESQTVTCLCWSAVGCQSPSWRWCRQTERDHRSGRLLHRCCPQTNPRMSLRQRTAQTKGTSPDPRRGRSGPSRTSRCHRWSHATAGCGPGWWRGCRGKPFWAPAPRPSVALRFSVRMCRPSVRVTGWRYLSDAASSFSFFWGLFSPLHGWAWMPACRVTQTRCVIIKPQISYDDDLGNIYSPYKSLLYHTW